MHKLIIVIDSGIGGKDFMKKLKECKYKCKFVKPFDSVVVKNDKNYVRYNIIKLLRTYSHTKVQSIIIACHSISSCIIDIIIKKKFKINNIPIYEPIIPMCFYISQHNKYRNILILSTLLTRRIQCHYNLLKSNSRVIKYLTFPRLAKELELGMSYNKSLERLQKAKKFIEKCDCIILGCTHYNIIKKEISQEVRNKYNFKGDILDSNEILRTSL